MRDTDDTTEKQLTTFAQAIQVYLREGENVQQAIHLAKKNYPALYDRYVSELNPYHRSQPNSSVDHGDDDQPADQQLSLMAHRLAEKKGIGFSEALREIGRKNLKLVGKWLEEAIDED